MIIYSPGEVAEFDCDCPRLQNSTPLQTCIIFAVVLNKTKNRDRNYSLRINVETEFWSPDRCGLETLTSRQNFRANFHDFFAPGVIVFSPGEVPSAGDDGADRRILGSVSTLARRQSACALRCSQQPSHANQHQLLPPQPLHRRPPRSVYIYIYRVK